MLCAVSHITGGLSFRPKTVDEGLQLVEKSAFLNFEERQNHFDPIIPNDRMSIPLHIQLDIINEDFMNKAKDNAKFDEDVKNKLFIQTSSDIHLVTPRHICSKSIDSIIPNLRQRRILHELHEAMNTADQNSLSYDPDMKIYTFHSNFNNWKVYLKGPEGTEYENKWWFLYVTFPELYPVEPPDIRFITVPYHLNVSPEGKICIDIITKFYNSSQHVVDIIQEIKELFFLPSIFTPVTFEINDMFNNNRDQYDKLARESCQNAKVEIDDYISSSLVNDEVPQNFNKVKHQAIVLASSGIYYYKDELKKLVCSNKNPVCVITGKILTEKPEDLDDPLDI